MGRNLVRNTPPRLSSRQFRAAAFHAVSTGMTHQRVIEMLLKRVELFEAWAEDHEARSLRGRARRVVAAVKRAVSQ